MDKNKIIKNASLSLLGIFACAAAWAQNDGTINYFVSPKSWVGTDADNTAVSESDYTKITSNGNKMYVNIALPDSMASGAASNYKVSDINSFSITTKQAEGSKDIQNAYFNIYTQKLEGSDSPNWYESRLNSEPYLAANLEKYSGAGNWYTWGTKDNGDNAYLTIYDSSANRADNGSGGFQGSYGVGATIDELKSGAVSITRPSETPFSRDYSQEKLNYIAINVNDTNNNMSNSGLGIKSFNMNLAGQEYAWNFLGEGSTWNVTGNQISADKIANMTVNVSGEGTVLNTRGGLSNSTVNVSGSATANIDNAEYKGIERTASWANTEYNPEPLSYVDINSTLKISNSTFEDNKFTHERSLASGVGTKGAIWVNGGTLEMSDSKIKGTVSVTIPGEKESWITTPNSQGGAILFNSNNGTTSSGVFSNVEISNNSASAMSVQGGAIAAFGGSFEFKDGTSFTGNKAMGLEGSTSSISGGALYMTDSWSGGNINLNVADATFSGNTAQGNIAYGGAIIYESYNEGSNFTATNTDFSGNKAIAETRAEGGALRIFTTSASEKTVLNDVSFTDNGVEVKAPSETSRNGGGAIYANASDIEFNVTKDAVFSGNYVSVNGVKTDELGGFMRLSSNEGAASSATFNVSDGATLTIGDGASGEDSIASTDASAVINKSGAGTLVVNGSMENFVGTLNVNEGTMSVNRGLGGEANVNNGSLNIANANYDGLNLEKVANGSTTAIVKAINNAELSLKNSSFKNNTVSTTGSANGTYGVAVGVSSSNAQIENTVFENNTNISTGSLMSQGVVYLTVSEQTNIKDSKFIGNKSAAEGSALGGAVSSFGSNLNIENTSFTGNSASGDWADGSAIYASGNDWGGADNSVVNISNSTFEGNVSEGTSIARGAVFIGGDNQNTLTVNITDSVFSNNIAKGNDYVAGGAISIQDQKVNINVTKDMSYVGNQAIVNGVSDDSKGGFLFINSKNVSSDTTFNIADNATLTIGDGREGYDSIASRDEKAIINKSGAGTLVVNGSMENFTGSLIVNQGEMSATNKLGASSISIADSSILRLSVGDSPVLTNENLKFSNTGTLALIAKNTASGKIATASGLDFGNVKAYGGTFDASSGTFSGYATEADYGTENTMQGAGIMKFSDNISSLTIATQGDTSFGENIRDDSIGAEFFGTDLLAAWNVTYDSEDTVVLSFMADKDMSGASLYHQESDGTWSKVDSWFEDDALNAITGETGNFAVAIPEPSVYAAILGIFSLVIFFKRRKN